jgi:hypothetical protein
LIDLSFARPSRAATPAGTSRCIEAMGLIEARRPPPSSRSTSTRTRRARPPCASSATRPDLAILALSPSRRGAESRRHREDNPARPSVATSPDLADSSCPSSTTRGEAASSRPRARLKSPPEEASPE